jgi:CBS domain-containing membrane protein
VGLRELAAPAAHVATLLSPAKTAAPDAPAVTLLPDLTDGRTHAVIVIDADKKVLGVISQTDLLSALGRTLFTRRAA